MTTTAPEPGQHVWIEAECVERVEGVNVFVLADPAFPDGYVPGAAQFLTVVDPDRVVWHPADPPQPPVLDAKALKDAVRHLTAALIAVHDRLNQPYSDMPELTPWTRFISPQLLEVRRLAGLDRGLSAPLADVPGPDDSAPTPEPPEAPPGDLMAALQDSFHRARAERERRSTPSQAEHTARLRAAFDLIADDLDTVTVTPTPREVAGWIRMTLAGNSEWWRMVATDAQATQDGNQS